MSPELDHLLRLRSLLIPAMYGAWALGIVGAILLARRAASRKQATLLVTFSVLGGLILGCGIFHVWWGQVLAAVSTPADHSWLGEHDGGAVIPYLTGVIICIPAWLVGLLIVAGADGRWPTERPRRYS